MWVDDVADCLPCYLLSYHMIKMDWSKFGQRAVVSVADIRSLFPGMPDEYFSYIQKQEDEPSLHQCDPNSADCNELTGCREDKEYVACPISVQEPDDSTKRTHAACGNQQPCNSDKLQDHLITHQGSTHRPSAQASIGTLRRRPQAPATSAICRSAPASNISPQRLRMSS